MDFSKTASEDAIQTTIKNLQKNGMTAEFVLSAKDAKEKILSLLPENAEVMTMTSITLETLGITTEINTSKRFISVRNKLNSLDRITQNREMQQLGAAPEYALGSVHAVTQDGQVIVVSNTGSQLPAYAYGSEHVIWVIGAQKIVKNLDEGMKRIYEYVLPKETKRARKAYGLGEDFHSNVSKTLIVSKEVKQGRINIIIVGETLGF